MDNHDASSPSGKAPRYRCYWVWVDAEAPSILHAEEVGAQDEAPIFGGGKKDDREAAQVLREAARAVAS